MADPAYAVPAYPQLLRAPGTSPWRALLGLLLAAAVAIALGVSVVSVALLLVRIAGGAATEDSLAPGTALGLLANNLVLAGLIPASVLAVAVVHRRPPGLLAGVTGAPRWGWLWRCLGVAAVVVLLAFGAGLLLPLEAGPGGAAGAGASGDAVWLLLLVIAVTTPLQAAGEEVAFRGYLTQAIGSWFARPVLGAVVAGLVSATLFALAHGSQNAWLFTDRLAFGLVASWLTWRTGGIEAAVALHVANNLVTLAVTALSGELQDALTVSSVSWPLATLDLGMVAAYALVVARLTQRPPRPAL